ncbi:hypothetical protein ACO2RV_25065, partial [Ancylobacter sp. VNQ12]|uniref:hypothetical protein n=1 Tax=Ancylobacter sp. VNQ12 TaxID=3400920 RepID=UPI003BFCC037
PRTLQDTLIVDRLVSEVTITDPHHALCGQRLTLVPMRSARGPAFVVVELPDGRRRSIRRSVTDLGSAKSCIPAPAPELLRVSVRTLVPLARHLTATLASSTEEVIRDGRSLDVPVSRCVSESTSTPRARSSSATALAGSIGRDTEADRSTHGRTAAADVTPDDDVEGGSAC